MSFLDKIFSGSKTSGVKKFEPLVPRVNTLEDTIKALSDADIKAKTAAFKKSIQDAKLKIQEKKGTAEEERQAENAVLEEILPEAFALVREAARRTLGQRHFDVQLIGGAVLHSGAIAEMRTGEGKTLVATLPAYVNALSGKGVHIVTVNDYLSRRDAVWMGQIYDFLGLTVGVINHDSSFVYDSSIKSNKPASQSKSAEETASEGDLAERQGFDLKLDKERDITGGFKVVHEFLRPVSRSEAYAADITYGTNNEFGFDYLRDNLEYSAQRLRQRDFNYAIVDEIDSILIDEARTPLIISAPTRDAEGTYKQFASMVANFKVDEDFTVDEKRRAISLTGAGITKAEKALGIDNIYTDRGIKSVHHLETAIKARALYHKDKEYVVKNNEIVIVDEFTGRLQPGRRWSDGLHQAIEAKEGVAIQQESRTFASITFQNFFRMYPKLSGMTGTAATSAEEFFKVYGLEVHTVPTNVPAVRKDQNDQIFRTEVGKFKAISRKVKELHEKGQPVLIGTVSIEKNELLSQFLKSEGVPHTMLNAKPEYAEKEGEIVAQAGKKGAVTIATNMAGRGVDIKLGGNPNTAESYEEIKKAGGLFVLGTERHEARRIDNQLRGRSGRQGDPGETQFFVSLEDQLMRVFASDTLKSMMGRLGMPEDEAIEHRLISKALESAQEKIEGFNFDARKHVLEFDDVINHQRASIYGMRRKLLMGGLDDVQAELSAMTGGDDGAAKIVENKIAEFGREPFVQAVRIVLLQTIDMYWVEHLEVMEYTRSSVSLRAYGQRDPLVEYKKEGLRLFKEMQGAMREQFLKVLPHVVPIANGQPLSGNRAGNLIERDAKSITGVGGAAVSGGSGGGAASGAHSQEPGRNDPCPCGSGRKYKNCGLKNTEEHQRLMATKK
ncbi:MAG: preprotein translocase subunit SecA [Patescibacteria group bacterium]|nr:preprotein translocase subunit SecA [Patescibacteria group bacterium]